MPIPWRRLLLPETLLKLVGRSPRTNVVTGDSRSALHRASAAQISWTGEHLQPLETAVHHDRALHSNRPIDVTAHDDGQLQESAVLEARAPVAPLQTPSAVSSNKTDSTKLSSLHSPESVPLHSRHRRIGSAASDVSLSSVVSTTGAYTGFTQAGQYDLTMDVILRGEFISEQQSKACGEAPHAMQSCLLVKLLCIPLFYHSHIAYSCRLLLSALGLLPT